jgi:UDP:flavonoid glycosyltransferase YjiC (YdhE family)
MKALFVPFAPSLAHVSRCLAVAEAWRTRGHTALFAVGPERRDMVENAGFEAQPLPEVSATVFRSGRGFSWLNRNYVEQNLDAEQEILESTRPDVVVFDFRFTSAFSARAAGMPSVGILHGNALYLASKPSEAALGILGDARDVRGVAALRMRVMHRVFPRLFKLVFRRLARRAARGLEARQVPSSQSIFEWLIGDHVLLADLPELSPLEPPGGCHVVGPLTWSGWDQPALWLDELDDRPIVYVTMSSTVVAERALSKIAQALGNAPYNVIMSTGGVPFAKASLPGNIRVFDTVPGAAVARRCQIAIHHAGHATLLQVLAAGTPSLVSPINPDQILVAQKVQALKLRRSLWQPNGLPLGTSRLERMTGAELRREIDDLLADGQVRETCRRFEEKMASYDGANVSVDVLERIVSASGS